MISLYPKQIQQYLRTFFTETNCPIVQESDHHLMVQLTIDMDKRIMNRPFYWSYVESTGGEPKPAQLTLISDKNRMGLNIPGEIVHYGSPRLNQLFQVAKERGAFVQLFEDVGNQSGVQTVLTPWLGVNYKITYSSDRTKEMLYSLGMNLMTGAIMDGFQEAVNELKLEAAIPPNTFYLPYIIKPLRAMERLEKLVDDLIVQDDHTWVEEAKGRRERDLQVLEYFYKDIEERPESYEMEKKAIEEQYETKIKVDVINGGLFYVR
ncbi:YqhG family protein [Sporosarcina sp. Te-1]|uniref:YqhG family protein n=1 Tax=Sporosarcina sp. Te-1 TaxID=2818390 RepID=UPI0035301D52